MKIYVFGNEDASIDNKAIIAAKKLAKEFKNIDFVYLKPNQDLPFNNNEDVVILDNVVGIEKVELLDLNNLDQLNLSPRTSVHDFDLGFQLKYLKKLGKINKVQLIAIPVTGKIDYLTIQLILRKLVAQDMQGS